MPWLYSMNQFTVKKKNFLWAFVNYLFTRQHNGYVCVVHTSSHKKKVKKFLLKWMLLFIFCLAQTHTLTHVRIAYHHYHRKYAHTSAFYIGKHTHTLTRTLVSFCWFILCFALDSLSVFSLTSKNICVGVWRIHWKLSFYRVGSRHVLSLSSRNFCRVSF